jgi:hypothetical protein
MNSDLLWREMCDVKYGENYLSFFIDKQLQDKRLVKVIAVFFSLSVLGGIVTWLPLTIISLIIILCVELFQLIENQILYSDKDLEILNELKCLHIEYFLELESLWLQYSSLPDIQNTHDSELNSLKKKYNLAIAKKDTIHIPERKKIKAKAELYTNRYLENFKEDE